MRKVFTHEAGGRQSPLATAREVRELTYYPSALFPFPEHGLAVDQYTILSNDPLKRVPVWVPFRPPGKFLLWPGSRRVLPFA